MTAQERIYFKKDERGTTENDSILPNTLNQQAGNNN